MGTLRSNTRSIRPALPAAALLTLMASNAQAVSFPNVPLESGAQFPPPNVMFILDDSGSMERDYMPDSVPAVAPFNMARQAYTRNSLYYNPATTYRPWIKADGTRYTGGTTMATALTSDWVINSSSTDLTAADQHFFVPTAAATDMAASSSYDMWRIKANNAGICKATYSETTLVNGSNVSSNSGMSGIQSFTVPAGVGALLITLSGGSHGNNNGATNGEGNGADLYVRIGNDDPGTSNWQYDYRSRNGENEESVAVLFPQSGAWRAGMYAASRFKNVALKVTYYWGNCANALPNAARTASQERSNFATWYSYHRTRMKVAKAGASEAFVNLPDNLRIGYTNIHDESANQLDIPVGSDGGLFRGQNRTDWFTKLHAEPAPPDNNISYTPLRTSLVSVGEYFKDSSASGPWGPGTGNSQLACRQNFAILTTDGYWNKDDESEASDTITDILADIGNEDGTAGPNGYQAVPPYADDHTRTLADVAMHYWKNDLRTDLANRVPVSSADPANWQHMTTFSISIGLEGTISPRTPRTTRGGTSGWPDPDPGTSDGVQAGIDDLWHASVNGRGNFIVARNASEFQRGLLDAFTLVAERTGSASNVTANSTSFTTDTKVFQASYVSGRWSGELLAYDATSAGLGNALWRASQRLPAVTRNFYTRNTATGAGATFPTAAQQTALNQSSRAISPASAAENVAYIKGARTLERQNGGGLRDRSSALGDIVNSSPFFAKDTNTLFVGANDGMLHAFHAGTGDELFAYVPGLISMADLGELSNANYSHKYFVDGPVVVSTLDQTPNKNYLVGALGRGGRGLFGLDVTTPSSFGTANVKWELTDDNLGQVLGEPLIATTNDAARKVVIVGNGLNSDNARAVLYVIDIATGAIVNELDTGVGGDNGLFAPRGWDNDGNGTVDYVYAGDRRGNLWKFDFTGTTPVIANGGNPLYTTGSGQPITTGVALAKDPLTNKRWVFFGTGSYLTTSDTTDNTVQTMFGVIDDGATVAKADLQARDIIVTTTVNGATVRGFEPLSALASGKKGWYIDLDGTPAGERVVTRPQVRGSVLVFTSRIPPTDNACDAGGSGYLNAVDAFTGGSTSAPYMDGNRDGSINNGDRVTSGGNTVPIGSIDLGIGMPTMPTVIDQLIVVGGSTGNLGTIKINPLGGTPKRASWREVLGD